MGSLATLVSRGERPRVRAAADRLHREAGRRCPASPPRLRRRVCFVVAAIAPHLSHDRLAVLARHALWSFRLDDRLDDQLDPRLDDRLDPRLDAPGAGAEPLARLAAAVTEVASGRPAGRGDPLLAELAGTVAALSRYDATGAARARFGDALRDAVTAEVAQARLGRAVAGGAWRPPTAEEYLAIATRTVNYRSFAYALLAVAAPPLAGGLLDRVDPALWHAARAVRLGNDLRSLERDRGDPAALNVLELRTAGGSPVTRHHLQAEIDRSLRAHDAALAPLAGAGAVVPALRRCLRVSVGSYRRTDLR